jgi:hypothetical protein
MRTTSCQVKEHSIHRAVVDLLGRAARPGVAWTHMPAGEARGPGLGGKLKGMGTKAGWPDLILIRDGGVYGLEIKRPAGRLSPAQEAAHAELRRAGMVLAVAYGLDEAIATLKDWSMLR